MIFKRIPYALAAALLLCFFSATAFASNIDEYAENGLEASGAAELSEYLSDDTNEYLDRLGFRDIELEAMLDTSPKAVFELLFDILRGGMKEPVKALLKSTGVVLLVSVCSGFFPDDEKSKTVLNLVCGCVTVMSVFVPAFGSIRAAVSTIGICAAFEKALIPVLAGVITASGNPTLALSFKGAAFAAAGFVESFSKNFALPLIGISGALSITGAMLPTLRLSSVSEIIRKTVTTALGCTAGLFTAFLALKSVLASSADALVVKGVKTAASFIPVVGSSLGEAYTSVAASLSLLKSTVGIYAVVAVLVTAIPVAINLALWILSMRVACSVSDLLDCRVCSEILKGIAFVFSMANAVLLLCTAVFVISSGLVVSIKNGG